MSETWFSDNYSDLSISTGVDAGFQFEFHCERCGNAYRTEFQRYKSAQAAGWLGRASGLLGNLAGSASNMLDTAAEAGFNKARDGAFREAVTDAKAHFKRCAKCYQYVCATCWNTDAGLCMNCAPDAEVEIEAAKAQGKVYAAGEKAALEGIQQGKKMDVKRSRQLVCPECGAEAHGAKFCPECGHKLAVKDQCPDCGVEVPSGSKFCPECGAKMPAG